MCFDLVAKPSHVSGLVLCVTLYLCVQASIHELWTEQQDNKRPLSSTVSCFYDELLTKWRKEVRGGREENLKLTLPNLLPNVLGRSLAINCGTFEYWEFKIASSMPFVVSPPSSRGAVRCFRSPSHFSQLCLHKGLTLCHSGAA